MDQIGLRNFQTYKYYFAWAMSKFSSASIFDLGKMSEICTCEKIEFHLSTQATNYTIYELARVELNFIHNGNVYSYRDLFQEFSTILDDKKLQFNKCKKMKFTWFKIFY